MPSTLGIIASSMAASAAPTDWTLYVPCITDYAKDPASTSTWTPPAITFTTPLAGHPDGQNTCVPNSFAERTFSGVPANNNASRETWTWWSWTPSSGSRECAFKRATSTQWDWGVYWQRISANQIDWGNFSTYTTVTGGATGGAWHHFAVVKTANNQYSIYVDGGVRMTTLTGGGPASDRMVLQTGPSPNRVFARIRRYNRNLTATEILDIFHAEGGTP